MTRADAPMAAAVTPERYTGQWIVFWCIAAALAFWATSDSRQPPVRLPAPAIPPGEGVDWFLVARLPEVPAYEAGTAVPQARLIEWLDAIQQAGFQPMLLSTVIDRLDQGLPLPRKTLVLMFHPGYRQTYEVVAPILEQYRIPAVWLTNEKAIKRGERKHLNRRMLKRMQRSGLWDVGWHEAPAENATSLDAELWPLPGAEHGAAPRAFRIDYRFGNQAMNQGGLKATLNRLSVPITWTGGNLADRLLAEAPIGRAAHLTGRRIGARTWGLAVDAVGTERQPFQLAAPLQSRVAALGWPGTSGKNDLVLDLQMQNPLGEVWLLLRSSPSAQQAIRIGFAPEAILIEQDRRGTRTRRAKVPWTWTPGQPLSAAIVLRGRRLCVAVNDVPLITLDSIEAPDDANGQVELVIYDKLRGAAGVGSASLVFLPLTGPTLSAARPVGFTTQEVHL